MVNEQQITPIEYLIEVLQYTVLVVGTCWILNVGVAVVTAVGIVIIACIGVALGSRTYQTVTTQRFKERLLNVIQLGKRCTLKGLSRWLSHLNKRVPWRVAC